MPLLKLKVSDETRSVAPRIENTWTDKRSQILKHNIDTYLQSNLSNY